MQRLHRTRGLRGYDTTGKRWEALAIDRLSKDSYIRNMRRSGLWIYQRQLI
jgi:hypothetical protein